jgi:hypothetical protein
MRSLGIVALGAALAGCASASSDTAPSYVSPVVYQSYNCQQLGLEAQGIWQRAAALSGAQDSQRTKDGLVTAAAIVVFWPAAFFVGGDKQTAAELANMKGQMARSSRRAFRRNATSNSKGSRRRERGRRSWEGRRRRKACPAAPGPTPKGGPHPSWCRATSRRPRHLPGCSGCNRRIPEVDAADQPRIRLHALSRHST